MSAEETGDLELLDVARAAAAAVTPELLRRHHAGIRELGTKSTHADLVTDADGYSAGTIAAVLRSRRPRDALLVEDLDPDDGPAAVVRWVVDPLDGTTNALYGRNEWAVSVAAQRRSTSGGWRTVAGVVDVPLLGETYYAVVGRGAWVGHRRLACRPHVSLRHALVGTEWAYSQTSRARQAHTLRRVLAKVRDVRCIGSSATALCWTAAGRLDAFWEDELQPWDVAAGALVCAEAGLSVSQLGTGVLAAPGPLHDDLLALVTPDNPGEGR